MVPETNDRRRCLCTRLCFVSLHCVCVRVDSRSTNSSSSSSKETPRRVHGALISTRKCLLVSPFDEMMRSWACPWSSLHVSVSTTTSFGSRALAPLWWPRSTWWRACGRRTRPVDGRRRVAGAAGVERRHGRPIRHASAAFVDVFVSCCARCDEKSQTKAAIVPSLRNGCQRVFYSLIRFLLDPTLTGRR